MKTKSSSQWTSRQHKNSPQTIYFVALGCAKNRVDTERMVGLAQQLDMKLVEDPSAADVIVVNSCGFIDPAKEESVNTVLELAEHKAHRCSMLVMAGCMVQRFPQELARELPEVDHFIGTADLPVLAKILAGKEQPRIAVGSPEGLIEQNYERALIGSPHSAYLKISEGCDRCCAFCIIPAIRGAQRSRTIDSLVTEAKQLVAMGAKELNLVAQDTTAYGRDLDASTENLIALLEALEQIECLSWIRLLYAYPSAVTPHLVRAMARLTRVVPYLDLPIQHVDDSLLRRMHRGYTYQHVLEVLKIVRSTIPEIYLRTTLITGHPGETEESQARLLDFVEAQQLDHVGVFPFSCEENTSSATQPDQVPTELAQKRAHQVMQLQQQISRQKLSRLRGRTITVFIEGSSPESEYLLQGRFYGQAPEVDGVVVVTNSTALPGELIEVKITDSADYDLVAEPICSDQNNQQG